MALKTLTLVSTYAVPSGSLHPKVDWHPSTDHLAVSSGASPYATVLSWSGSALTLAATYVLPAESHAVAWHPDGLHVAFDHGYPIGTVTILNWNGSSLSLAATYAFTSTNVISSLSWHPGGEYLALASSSGTTVLLWNGSNALSVAATYSGGTRVQWHPSTDHLAVVYANSATVLDWNGSNALTVAATYSITSWATGVSWKPSGDALAALHHGPPHVSVFEWDGTSTLSLAASYSLSTVPGNGDWHPTTPHLLVSVLTVLAAQVLEWRPGSLTLATAQGGLSAADSSAWHPGGVYAAIGLGGVGVAVYAWEASLDIVLDTPTNGEALTEPEIEVGWTTTVLAGSPVYEHRVLVTQGETVVYDSGLLTQATQSHTIPPGYLNNIQTYEIRVRAIDPNDGDTVEDSVSVTSEWTPLPAMEGVTVTPVTDPLPGMLVEWPAATVEEPHIFSEYNVYRRVAEHSDAFGRTADAGPWVRIARLLSYDALEYTDHNCGSGIAYEYAVTWWALGGLQSEQQAPPPADTVTWSHAYIHDVADPEIFTPVPFAGLGVEQQQDIVDTAVRGRASGVAFTGERFERVLSLAVVPGRIRGTAPYERLREMLKRQHTAGATYCLRIGHSGEVVFGRLEPVRRTDQAQLATPDIRFVERHYTEAR